MATKAKTKPKVKTARKQSLKTAIKPKRGSAKTLSAIILRQSLRSFLVRFVSAFVALVFLIPVVLLLLYRFEFVHPISTLMVKDSLIGHGAKREWIDIDDMAPVVYQSVLSSEDGKFCSHSGVDWGALNQVIEDAIDGEKNARC